MAALEPMDGDSRHAAIAAAIHRLADAEHRPIGIGHICRACARIVAVDGVSFCVAGDLDAAEPIYATDVVGERAVEWEITVGEGPGVQALATGQEVLVGDLAARGSYLRWPVLVPLLVALGVRAVFALPLAMSGVTVGVLQMYRRHARSLTAGEVSDGCVFADYALTLLIDTSAQSPDDKVDGVLAGALAQQWTRVYQAVGIVAAQLDTGLTAAFQRLRAHAFVTGRPLREVANAVLDGGLRFTC